MTGFLELPLEIRFTDVVDILVVTALVYTAGLWIRRTPAALVAVGILLLGALYVAARALGLQLTAWFFQGFFAIFLIIIVVIFQEELRQLFERVAMWGLRRGSRAVGTSEPTDILVQCLTDLARDRIGALVVIPGTQPLGRHVRGGIALEGKLSVPLLKSIFDPHSPGHDGAVIVEDGRVTRFAAHLPLSRDLTQLSGVGTRHSAALGLAELTDALCLVVSEERGSMSIAKGGRLRRLGDPQELGTILHAGFEAPQPARDARHLWNDVVREDWVAKLTSLVAVLALWCLFVPGARPTQRTFEVPVTVSNLPNGYALEGVHPGEVKATLSGPARAFYLFDRRRLEVTVDAMPAEVGRRTVRLSEANVRCPRDVTVEDIRPAEVRIALRRVSGGPGTKADAGGS